MADIVVQTIDVHDIGAALYGVLQSIENVDSALFAAIAAESVEEGFSIGKANVTELDSLAMLTRFEAWRVSLKLPMPDVESDQLAGIYSSASSLRNLLRQRRIQKSVVRSPVVAPRFNPAAIANRDYDTENDDQGETDDEEFLGFIGVAIRAALVGARVLLRRVGAKRAMVLVGGFAKRAAVAIVAKVRAPAGSAAVKSAAKYLAVGGAISLGGGFAADLARRIGGGAAALGKGAIWLLAAYAGYLYLNQSKR